MLLAVAVSGCGGFYNEPLGLATVRGRVPGANPAVASVHLHLLDGQEEGEDEWRTGVDGEGRFELRRVQARRAVLFVIASPTEALRLTVSPQGGKVLELGDLVPEPGALLTIQVLAASGFPASGAQVDVKDTPLEELPVDAQGRVAVGPLPPGCYRVEASDEQDEAREDVCVRAGETPSLTLVLGSEPEDGTP